MDGDSSPSTSSSRNDAPSATLDVFAQLVRHDAGASGDGKAEGERRTKLFMMATKLAKLNLLEDSASSSSSLNASLAIWETVLQFLKAYPDYLFYKPAIAQSEVAEHEEPEEMGVWLLPRLLRRIAVLGAEARPSDKVNNIKETAEAWLSSILAALSTQFYRKEQGGISKQREYVQELLSLLQNLQDHLQLSTKSAYPVKLWLFDKASRSVVNGVGKDPFLDSDRREKRPFAILLQSVVQARSLFLSLASVLCSVVLANPDWLHSFLPDMVQAIIGTEQDWNLPTDPKGKCAAQVPDASIAERLALVTKLATGSAKRSLSRPLTARGLNRILQIYEHSVLSQTDAIPPTTLTALLQALDGMRSRSEALQPISIAVVRDTVSRNEESILASLRDRPPIVDIDTGQEDISAAQAATLLVLAIPLEENRTAPHEPSSASHSIACECMTDTAQQDLHQWLQQYSKLAVTDNAAFSSRLSNVVSAIKDAMHSVKSRKRKASMNGEATQIYNDEIEAILKGADIQGLEGWRTHGWQHAFAEFLGKSPIDCPRREALLKLVSVEAKHHGESPGLPSANEDSPTDEVVRPVQRARLSLISEALLKLLASRNGDMKQRAADYATLATVLDYERQPIFFHDARMGILLADLQHKNRLVRLAAGQAGNALILAHQANNAALDGHGHVGRYFDALKSIIASSAMSVKATAITTAAHLCRDSEEGILGQALKLLLLGLAEGGQLKAFITTQVGFIVTHRKTGVYRLFAPQLEALCPVLAQRLDASFSLLHDFCQLIATTPKAFLINPATTRILLASAVAERRKDVIQQLSAFNEMNPVKLIVLNADCIFAPLFLSGPAKLSESEQFLSAVYRENQVNFVLKSLLESTLSNLLFELIIRVDAGPDGKRKLQEVMQSLYYRINTNLSFASQAIKSSTVLAVFGKAGDVLRGEYGKKTSAEKIQILQGLGQYAQVIGAHISAARPQMMTILQTSFADSQIRLQTLSLWHLLFARVLVFEDIKPLLAATTASFVQTYPHLSDTEKSLVQDILKYVIMEKSGHLGAEVHSIANMDGLPDLSQFQHHLLTRRQQQSFTSQLHGFLARLETVNEIVLVQSLRELSVFLQQRAADIHKLASGNVFDPCLGKTVHELLSVAIRNAEAKAPARPLALRCLGMLGALDPDRLSFPTEEEGFALQNDLREEGECMAFAMYTIEKVLVKVLRSTSNPHQQAALFLAIQGLAAVCGFDQKLRTGGHFQMGVEAAVRQRWNAVPKAVQEIVEPIISAQIELQSHATETNTYPLYCNKASYREWLQAWTSDLIEQLVQGHSGLPQSGKSLGPKALFGPLKAAVRGGHDLSVAYYILPYLVFYAIGVGNTSLTTKIREELQTVLEDRIWPRQNIAMNEDSRSLCAQAIFELMDHLNTWVRSRHVFVARKYRKRDPHRNPEAANALLSVKRIEIMLQALPQNAVADAAFNSKSYARALLNYEKILHDQKLTAEPATLQPYYERLHHIYAELNEPDGMEGVSTSIISPSIQHQIREHEMTGRWTSAQSCWEVQLQLQPEDPESHLGLLRCLRNLGHYDSLRTHIAGLQTKRGEWRQLLSPFEIESSLIAGDLDSLRDACDAAKGVSPEAAFGQFVLAKVQNVDVDTARNDAAEQLGGIITTASKDSYYRFYGAISNLHILHELDMLLTKHAQKPRQNPSRADLASLTARLDLTAPSFQTREAILNMRRNAYRISADATEPNIGPLWLATSKIALKANHLQTAYSAILQASQLQADFTFLQSAKLYKANDQLYRALQELEQGLNGLGAFRSNTKIDQQVTKQLAKATLRSARWMQETGRFDSTDINARYKRAIALDQSWEAAYYRFGQYADDIVQSSLDFDKNAKPNTPAHHRNTQLLLNMGLVVHNFSKALRFGAKFLYQSLPRLLTIWLDFATREEFRLYDPGKGQEVAASNREKVRKTSSVPDLPAVIEGRRTFDTLHTNVRRAYDKLPPYMWLAVLPQLASRLWHDNNAVASLLVLLVERTIHYYPQQAMWTIIGTIHSEVKSRRERGNSILQRAQARSVQGQQVDQPHLRKVVVALNSLVQQFLDISACPTDPDGHPLSVKARFPSLRQMVPCDIIIPFQDSMIVTLPTATDAAGLMSHRPFRDNLVTFKGFEDTIELMNSVARPRKLVIEGSDGCKYRFLCKPLDDLRKDNRLMDCTSLVNRLLMKDADSRKRTLRIRTYAVIPLSEKCGLIEWVPDTAGLRNIWQKLYEPKGISVWNDKIKAIYDTIKSAQKNDLAKCAEVFNKQILPQFPPIFHHWFLDHFPEPTAWLKARTSYGRTAAVMSMVGFVLGLGDRHGENILIDQTNGDVVHVDFNCLFGMGLVWFDIVEKVPFRLTQNVIDGFGITGVEGVFRNACEITMRILRENKTSLINVLESFVHDPLLDLQLSRPGARKSSHSAKNETKDQKAAREQEMRQEEARRALATIGNKLKGTQSTLAGPPGETVSSVEMTVETLFKEATDAKNLGGMYCGWSGFL